MFYFVSQNVKLFNILFFGCKPLIDSFLQMVNTVFYAFQHGFLSFTDEPR